MTKTKYSIFVTPLNCYKIYFLLYNLIKKIIVINRESSIKNMFLWLRLLSFDLKNLNCLM